MSLTLYRADGTVKDTDYLATPSALDIWHTVGDAVTGMGTVFQNSWTDGVAASAGTEPPPQFRKYPDGKVKLRGILNNGTATAAIFTLPVGYRPLKDEWFVTTTQYNSGPARFDVYNTGQIVPSLGGGGAWAALSNIIFDTDPLTQWVVPVGAPTLTARSGSLGSNVALGVNTNTDVFSTAALEVGTWLVTMGATCTAGGASAVEVWAAVGTAVAALTGKVSGGVDLSGASIMGDVTLSFVVVVTTAGTLKLVGRGSSGSGSTVNAQTRVSGQSSATGYTAARLA